MHDCCIFKVAYLISLQTSSIEIVLPTKNRFIYSSCVKLVCFPKQWSPWWQFWSWLGFWTIISLIFLTYSSTKIVSLGFRKLWSIKATEDHETTSMAFGSFNFDIWKAAEVYWGPTTDLIVAAYLTTAFHNKVKKKNGSLLSRCAADTWTTF